MEEAQRDEYSEEKLMFMDTSSMDNKQKQYIKLCHDQVLAKKQMTAYMSSMSYMGGMGGVGGGMTSIGGMDGMGGVGGSMAVIGGGIRPTMGGGIGASMGGGIGTSMQQRFQLDTSNTTHVDDGCQPPK
jgi:hypothetical protein